MKTKRRVKGERAQQPEGKEKKKKRKNRVPGKSPLYVLTFFPRKRIHSGDFLFAPLKDLRGENKSTWASYQCTLLF